MRIVIPVENGGIIASARPLGALETVVWLVIPLSPLCSLFILIFPSKREKGRRGRRVVAELRAMRVSGATTLVAGSSQVVAPARLGPRVVP
jgi:hypothetical protein